MVMCKLLVRLNNKVQTLHLCLVVLCLSKIKSKLLVKISLYYKENCIYKINDIAWYTKDNDCTVGNASFAVFPCYVKCVICDVLLKFIVDLM